MAKKKRKKGKKVRLKTTWTEFRAGLARHKVATLLRIIKILWASASTTAKNKVCNIAAQKPRVTRKEKSKSKAKSKRRSKGKTKKGMKTVSFIPKSGPRKGKRVTFKVKA